MVIVSLLGGLCAEYIRGEGGYLCINGSPPVTGHQKREKKARKMGIYIFEFSPKMGIPAFFKPV
jgi:hypothetical protein